MNTTILNVQDTSMGYKWIWKNVARTIANIKLSPQKLWIGGFKKDSQSKTNHILYDILLCINIANIWNQQFQWQNPKSNEALVCSQG